MDRLSFYQSRIADFTKQRKTKERQLFQSSMMRLFVFLAAAFLLYRFFGEVKSMVLIVLVAVLAFFFLIIRHSKLKYERNKIRQLIAINATEIEVLNREFSKLPTGEEFEDHQHFFSQDIDLFGKHSFFQYLNRTALKSGKNQLAQILEENTIQDIEKKQRFIKELGEKVAFRQEFSAVASLMEDSSESKAVLSWFSSYTPFVPSFFRWLSIAFSGASVVFFVGLFLDIVSWEQLLLWLCVGLGITGFYVKKINTLASEINRVQAVFEQFHQLIKLLEETDFSSELGQELTKSIRVGKTVFSRVIHRFSKQIDALEQRNNLLFGMVGNGFLLWDLYQCLRIEKWIQAHGHHVENWFALVSRMDAYNSLGNFVYNHPEYVFPAIQSEGVILKSEQAVHPLIPPEKAVRNDFLLGADEFFIVTGANMAGKSTFLRTVALQIVMANVGLPVCADACEYRPVKLITSMRTNDSLSDESSYFYAELSRLKYIVNHLKEENYFVVLDEILKGTNSADKAIGSRKFVEKLIRSGSSGIIATHDLSLCEVEKEYAQIKNYYFDAEISEGELYFDYTFKKGVCHNMNASFLLKKMEIID